MRDALPPPPSAAATTAAATVCSPRASDATEYNPDGSPRKSNVVPAGTNRPGAYAGAPGTGYGRVASARYHMLGSSATSAEGVARDPSTARMMGTMIDTSASDRMVIGDNPPPALDEATEEQMDDEPASGADIPHLEAPCEVAPPPPTSNHNNDHHNANSKDKLEGMVKKYKTILMMAGVVLVLVITVAIVVPVVVLGSEDDNKGDNMEATITMPPNVNVDPTLIPGVPDSTWVAMFDQKSPQYKAYSWMVKDPILMEYEDWQKRQRFALATFFYAMGGPRWESGNWLNYEINECQWMMDPKTCHEDMNIKFLNITKQRGFKGSMPMELTLLTKLEGMDFSHNLIGSNLTGLFGNDFNHPTLQVFWCVMCRLGGTLPVGFLQMPNFRALELNDNDITGELPSEIGHLSWLKILELENNQFTGPVPTTFGNMQSLEWLKIRDNLFTSIPSEVGKLNRLINADFGNNRFKQSVPSELGLLSQLKILELDRNNFQGAIPSQLGSLTKLTRLLLNENELSGSIPDELGLLSSLVWLWLIENELVGSIPTSLGQLTRVTNLDLGDNILTSTIPSELGFLLGLQSLGLFTNELSGTIPSEIASLAQLKTLDVTENPFIVQEVPEEFCANPEVQLTTDWCTGSSCCARR